MKKLHALTLLGTAPTFTRTERVPQPSTMRSRRTARPTGGCLNCHVRPR